MFGPKDVRAHCDSHIVRRHPVFRLVLHYHLEHLYVELEGIKVDLGKLVNPILELHKCKYQSNAITLKEFCFNSFNLRRPVELFVQVIRDQRLFHVAKQSFPVVCHSVWAELGLFAQEVVVTLAEVNLKLADCSV